MARKQARFVEEYPKDRNGTGYGKAWAHGSPMLIRELKDAEALRVSPCNPVPYPAPSSPGAQFVPIHLGFASYP